MKNLYVVYLILALVGLAGCTPTAKLTEHTRQSGGTLSSWQDSLRIEHVRLDLQVFPDSKSIAGQAQLRLVSSRSIQRLALDLDANYHIERVLVNQQTLALTAWSNPTGQLQIELPSEQPDNQPFTLTVLYQGKPHVAENPPWLGGFVWSTTKNNKPWIATAVQGEGCDIFWPCIDHPTAEPGQVDLFIKVPAGLAAPSNGTLINLIKEPKWHTYHWRTDNPNTYAIALNIGPYALLDDVYDSRYGNRFPLQYWYLQGEQASAEKLFTEFTKQLDFFEQVIGPYPFASEKMGVVHTPHKGMEHQTINAYGEDYRQSPYGYDGLLQHELAHEWFGNQLTNKDWDDFWLHEGFGTYMQPLYAEYLRGKMAYHAHLFEMRSQIVNKHPLVSKRSKKEHEVYDPKLGPGQDIYVKGAWILHTLRHLVGDEVFFNAVRQLVYGTNTPEPGNFTPRFSSSEEFIRIISTMYGQDLQWFFDAYLYQATLPVLQSETENGLLKLRWKSDKPFYMPLEVMIDGTLYHLAMSDGTADILVSQARQILLDPENKILRQEQHIDDYQQWQRQQQRQ